MTDTSGLSLKEIFSRGEQTAYKLESLGSSSSAEYQENVRNALELYKQSALMAESLSLFSMNESLEDLTTTDIPYLLIDFRRASLIEKLAGTDAKTRLANIHQAESCYSNFLLRLNQYELLTVEDGKLWDAYQAHPDTFSTSGNASTAEAKRTEKINRFRHEKSLKETLKALQSNPQLTQDDDIRRELYLTGLNLGVYETFKSLESLQSELKILAFAKSDEGQTYIAEADARDSRQQRGPDTLGGLGDSERVARLTAPSSEQPFLSAAGKLLRPVTILGRGNDRQQMTKNVFRPGHNLPTMSIDEYLEEEKRRGGIIEGGGPDSGRKPDVDEDDHDIADKATMKARDWDEFTEANPRGAGNTLNRG